MANASETATLVVAINDLIFATKIRTTADRLGVSSLTTRDSSQIDGILDEHKPTLLLIDLNTLSPGAVDVVRAGCTHACAPVVIAFVSHVDERLAREAVDAGAHHVLPRSKFSADLPDIISEHCCKTQ
jgi:DNA-binding NarL/FixJ family response regulator